MPVKRIILEVLLHLEGVLSSQPCKLDAGCGPTGSLKSEKLQVVPT